MNLRYLQIGIAVLWIGTALAMVRGAVLLVVADGLDRFGWTAVGNIFDALVMALCAYGLSCKRAAAGYFGAAWWAIGLVWTFSPERWIGSVLGVLAVGLVLNAALAASSLRRLLTNSAAGVAASLSGPDGDSGSLRWPKSRLD